MDNKKIIRFLEIFGTILRDNESEDYVELMMDNHICIKYKKESYYIPKNSSCYSDEDINIYKYLKNNFKF